MNWNSRPRKDPATTAHLLVNCRSCNALMIFLKTSSGKRMPVDAETVEAGDHTYDHRKHKSHYATCPDAAKYRKP